MYFLIANWKMYPSTQKKAESLLKKTTAKIKGIDPQKGKVIICPPFVYLQNYIPSKIELGAQNCFWKEEGAFTGEISPSMLKSLSVKYVILGHSERRKYFKEQSEDITKKVKVALKNNITPILCIGETKQEREKGDTGEVLKKQLKESLEDLAGTNKTLFIAYEPIWAIGSGNNCSPDEAMSNLIFIRKQLSKIFNQQSQGEKSSIKILYGGSADSSNTKSYLEAGFDGLLVGSASLQPAEFSKMCKIAEQNA